METIKALVQTNVDAVVTILGIIVTAIIQSKHLLKKLKDETKKK